MHPDKEQVEQSNNDPPANGTDDSMDDHPDEQLKHQIETLSQMLEQKKKELRAAENKRRKEERDVQRLRKHISTVEVLKAKAPVPSFKIRHPRGVVGLQNLGNTCFMNSALQCLAKSPSIYKYFLNDEYKKEINKTNRLGTGGELVNEFATFLKQIFNRDYADLSPRCMKFIVGKFCSQFEGFMQQDSAEFIQYVLDGLHEDLNRIIEKPLTDPVESKGRPDEEVAEEAWVVHKKRNDSIFVDKFQGQMRSTLMCPNCKKGHSTFDPFFSLTLPVPIPTRFRKFTFVYFPLEQEKPLKQYGVVVKESTGIKGLRGEIASTIEVDQKSLVIAEMDKSNNSICQVYYDDQPQKEIYEQDRLYVFEIPELATHPKYENDIHKSYLKTDLADGGLPFARVEVFSKNSKYPLLSFMIPFIQDGEKTNRDMYKWCLRGLSRFQLSDQIDPENIPFELSLNLKDGSLEPLPQNDELAMRAIEPPRQKYGHNDVADYQLIRLDMPASYGSLWDEGKINQKFESIEKDESAKQEIVQERPKTLYECLDLFSTEEVLSEGKNWECPECGEKVNRLKKTDIWRLPETLIIQLNRFQYQGYTRTKLTHPIDFPVYNLDMSDYTSNPNNPNKYYDLFGVSNHYGTLASGHYTSFGKVTDEKSGEQKWHKYDDMVVTEIDTSEVEKEIVTPAGYVLFFHSKPEKTEPPRVSSKPKVTISVLNGPSQRMEIHENSTMSDLKDFVKTKIGWSPDKYRAVFNTKELDVAKDALLKELEIGPDSTVFLINKAPSTANAAGPSTR